MQSYLKASVIFDARKYRLFVSSSVENVIDLISNQWRAPQHMNIISRKYLRKSTENRSLWISAFRRLYALLNGLYSAHKGRVGFNEAGCLAAKTFDDLQGMVAIIVQ